MSDEPKQVPEPRNVHEAILAVMREVGYVQKTRSPNLNYSFASERELIAAVRPYMIAAGLYMAVVDYREIARSDYTTKNQAVMNSTSVFGIVRFQHFPSNTFVDVASIGEGADVGDKSANKAATGMYKYAIRQTFMIETGDDPDTFSSESQERAGKPAGSKNPAKPTVPASTGTPPANGNATEGNKPPVTPGNPVQAPAGTAPGTAPAGKTQVDPNDPPTPGMIANFNAVIADAASVGIKVNVDPAKMTAGKLAELGKNIKKQIATAKSRN